MNRTLFDLPFEEPEPEPEPQAEKARLKLGPSDQAAAGWSQAAPPAPGNAASERPGSAASEGLGFSPGIPTRQILTVSELTANLREVLETTFPEIWVEGELSNAKVWTTGHLYFTLKDGGSQVKGVMFRSALRYLKFKPEDGLHVVVRGRISVYDPKGEYQLVGEHMEPHGFGALQLAFEQLKKKLAAEGLFAAARKRPLPALPRRVGIVTSIDGAALRDIVRVLRRRYPNAHLVIAPSRVQGEDAAGEIVRALRLISRIDGVDVVILGRGGGSLEDLWAFNEEKVARAIAASPVPVISAVGHETDVTIADFVADLRAPTPSAAAELVVRRKDDFCHFIDRLSGRLDAAMRGRVSRLESRLNALLARPGYAGRRGQLAMRGRHVAELTSALRHGVTGVLSRRARHHEGLRRALTQFDPRHRLAAGRTRLATRDGQLAHAATRRLHAADARFKSLAARLDGLSPLSVLARGYAVAWDASRSRIIREASTVTPGEEIIVRVERGEIRSVVRTTET
jgi:exodeoxyribonuclease VII large subunit